MACMFTMMNNARLMSGCRALRSPSAPISRRVATRAARRVQGLPVGRDGAARIAWHSERPPHAAADARPDRSGPCLSLCHGRVARTSQRAQPTRPERSRAQARAELLVPMVKAWSTDLGVENASLAVQVHGGMGFIEETGVAQHYRDARVAPIYEGTNGIQALDLLGRKLVHDEGDAARALIAEMRGLHAGSPVSPPSARLWRAGLMRWNGQRGGCWRPGPATPHGRWPGPRPTSRCSRP